MGKYDRLSGWGEGKQSEHGYSECPLCARETFHMVFKKDGKKVNRCQVCGGITEK